MFFSRILLTLMVSGASVDGGTLPPAGAPAAAPVVDAGVPAVVVDAGVAKVPLAPPVKVLVDRVQAFYEKTTDFQADFKQEYTYKAFKRTQVSTGKVTFKKPGLMRWEYEKPSPKTFVLAGDRVFAHDPEAKLVTRAAINTNQLSASVTFLFGVGKLENEFNIVQTTCAKCVGTQLEMTPLVPDSRFKKIYLEVDPTTAQVLKSTVIDPDGSENAISFIGLKANVGINEAHFKITPPPGTQVQDFLTGAKTSVPSATKSAGEPGGAVDAGAK